MSFYAYIHCKPDGTPFYVGKGLYDRVKLKERKHNKWHCNILQKYGKENILVGSMECSSEDISFQLEIGLIKRLKAMGVELVNQTEGGEGRIGGVVTEDVRKRISEKLKGTQNFLGQRHSKETREKIGRAQLGNKWSLGRKLSEEHKKKVSLALTGHKFTEESKSKIAEKLKGNKNALGMRWITDGTSNRRLRVNEEIPVGWRIGKIYRTKR